MQSPFLYLDGPIALNYGGIGMIIAHEIMHAFDVDGIQVNKHNKTILTSEFVKEYTKRALCLRHSHKSVLSLSGHHETLNDTVDSENLADLVGTMVAYAAYSSLPQKYKDVKLVNLDISTERLFFINHCVKWCAERTTLEKRYAPLRSRCIVPLMNMPEFSRAFGCAPGSPMNPREKCAFW
ncbi:membrane metallo-endopeptidase-like 1 [Rhipicephalus microplus]|uniref:membrane metallo-endopeptidase-like 1 n=1 Tax=Rhipicephalus microplus TaxID=6941 RepID=UPI003F6C5477